MHISVINLTKKSYRAAFISLLLILILLLSSVIGVGVDMYFDVIETKASTDPKNTVIIIDAGHGGEDSGAVGGDGSLEKNLNLEISFEIGAALNDAGYTVVYTRTEDKLLYLPEENIKGIRKISDLKNRCKVAQEYPNSIFISVHMNSYGSSKYSGLQVYYSENDESSRTLANMVQDSVKDKLQKENNRKIKAGKDIYVLEHISVPAILIECGFMSNPEECKKLSEKEYQKELSFSIVCGIIEYIQRNSDTKER